MTKNFVFFSFVLVIQLSLIQALYKNQDQWPLRCRKSIYQSPVDLDSSKFVPEKHSPLVFKNWDRAYNATIKNIGYTVMVQFDNDEPISITGGGLEGVFHLYKLQFHWGSEHTVNGERKPLEAQFVAINRRFKDYSYEEAVKYANGVAAIIVLYNHSNEDNDRLKPILDQVGKLKKHKSSTKAIINPGHILKRDFTKFLRYWGSKTVPDCNEGIIFTVLSQFCNVSKAQIDKFATIEDDEGEVLKENFRKVQPLHGRNIYAISTSG